MSQPFKLAWRLATRGWPAVTAAVLLTGTAQAQLSESYDDVFHVLRRTSFGPTTAAATELLDSPDHQSALKQYILDQLNPDSLPAEPANLAPLLADIHTPGAVWTLEAAQRELVAKALFSNRQLEAVMGYFWRRHFNTSYDVVLGKLQTLVDITGQQFPSIAPALPAQAAELIRIESEAFRAQAFGSFGDLLATSALSPTMILFLDSVANIITDEDDRANENYARELLELHTLGLNEVGLPEHYSQIDVRILADVFTGWSIEWDSSMRWVPTFREGFHRDSSPPVDLFPPTELPFDELGNLTGVQEGIGVLQHLAGKRETAEFICRKLYKFFISETVPEPSAAIDAAVEAWLFPPPEVPVGSMRDVLAALLLSDEFLEFDEPLQINRWNLGRMPLEALAAPVRLFDGQATSSLQLDQLMADLASPLGQRLFQFPAPNGFQVSLLRVLSTTQLLGRTNANQRIYQNRLDLPSGVAIDYDPVTLIDREAASFSYSDVAATLMTLVAQNRWLQGEKALIESFLSTEVPGQPFDRTLQELFDSGNVEDRTELTERLSHALTLAASLPQNTLK